MSVFFNCVAGLSAACLWGGALPEHSMSSNSTTILAGKYPPVWSSLTESAREIPDACYADLCANCSEEQLAIECRALSHCLFESSLVDSIALVTYRRRYAQAFGALIALRAFHQHAVQSDL